MSVDFDDDLLTPTLTAEDDAVGFDRPWNPWSLVVLTFFFGLIAGGGLLALNFRRLGQHARVWPTLAAVVVIGPGLLALAAWQSIGDPLQLKQAGLDWVARTGLQVVSCAVAGVIALQQRRRYRLFQMSGLPSGSLLWPAIAAIGVWLLVYLLLGAYLALAGRTVPA